MLYEINRDFSTITNTKTGFCFRLGKHEFELLEVFLSNHGTVIDYDELIRLVWKHKVVTKASLVKAICTLRFIFNDEPPYKIIVNKPRTGYYLNSSYKNLFNYVDTAEMK